MEVFKTIKSLQQSLRRLSQNKTVGLVPTMGALHEGHLSIIDKAKKENDIVIASIFVNPTQFDKKEDLINYPSTLESDLEALDNRGCDLVFTPTIHEIYQGSAVAESFDFKGLDKEMEGKFRTGHFDGVATIVKKLFLITSPNRAYFGEKDFQQLQIIKQMVRTEGLDVDIIPVEIFRETDGLAMSSRNTRLNDAQRKAAPEIYQTLLKGKKLFQQGDLDKVKSFVKNELIQNKELALEYFEIADNESLKPAKELDPEVAYRAFIAVFAGDIRLIDNIALN